MNKFTQLELVQKIQALAVELGRTPTVNEFSAHYHIANTTVIRICGSWLIAVQAAGLESAQNQKVKRIDNSIFETSIDQHIQEYQPREIKKNEPYKRCIFIGDAHHPFSHQETLEWAYRITEKFKPEIIIQGGDLYDMYSHSKFPRSHNVFLPKEENELARSHAEKMWAELKNVAPDAKCYQLWGNHDVRPLKRVLEVYPSAEDWINEMMSKMMSFPGVETMADYRTELFLPGNVQVIHGHRSKLGDHRDFSLMNSVNFHTHTGGVAYRNIFNHGIRWELNGGFVADPEAKGLTYTPQRITNWTRGIGILDEMGPRFIPKN